MREPDFDLDGWCLEDGEALHREAPETFWLPDLEQREALQPGDYAKLIFRIAVDKPGEPVAVERMWVLVRGRVGDHYFGILDNDPYAIEENDEFWSGIELPFAARHVINIDPGDEATRAQAAEAPRRAWPRK
ncbi:hypothetical protein IC614_11080 [Allosphingosinicella flava]|uniref:DUF2314 domain-containing protein n=1 Tax=Allosphingosinicella flava TaxID=2771430 RepID=A0A7T2LLY4_9SPHN|nr:hypothetical protein [Sphingosinicella flava]QPQ54848.1 hypothetical protein IC614_11080 [Sphingosinicella flava]